MKTYNYTILNLVTSDKNQQMPKYVKRVLTNIQVVDQNNKTASMDCFFNLPDAESGNFLPFEQLDESVIRLWVDACTEQWQIHQRDLDSILKSHYPDDPLQLRPVPWLAQEIPTVNQITDPVDTEVLAQAEQLQQQQQRQSLESLIRQIISEQQN